MGPKSGKGVNIYHDVKRMRFVVHRRDMNIHRKTSVRYGRRAQEEAYKVAVNIATQLKNCPVHLLAKFQFNRNE